MDRALGQLVPGAPSTTSTTDAAAAAMPSPLASVDGFRVVMTRFEKLSRSSLPRGVSELVYGDAYLVALSLSRRREVRFHFSLVWHLPRSFLDFAVRKVVEGFPPEYARRTQRYNS